MMTTRSRTETIRFSYPFRIKGVERTLPAGTYDIVSEDELIEGLSFPCYRRVSTFIMAPAAPPYQSSMEMVSIAPLDLADAQRLDASARIDSRQ
jgi:hypothetical protein